MLAHEIGLVSSWAMTEAETKAEAWPPAKAKNVIGWTL